MMSRYISGGFKITISNRQFLKQNNKKQFQSSMKKIKDDK